VGTLLFCVGTPVTIIDPLTRSTSTTNTNAMAGSDGSS
jgi:hypothetical protein